MPFLRGHRLEHQFGFQPLVPKLPQRTWGTPRTSAAPMVLWDVFFLLKKNLKFDEIKHSKNDKHIFEAGDTDTCFLKKNDPSILGYIHLGLRGCTTWWFLAPTPPRMQSSPPGLVPFLVGNSNLNLYFHWHPGWWVDPTYGEKMGHDESPTNKKQCIFLCSKITLNMTILEYQF